jgi:hypothetical protein
MGCVYIPPENTKYSSTDAFSDIENEMFNLVKNGEHVSLLGDFNAKSGKLSDYVKPDEELLDIFDLYEDIDLISYMYDYENLLRANIPLDRKSLCTGKPTTFPVHFRVICNCLCTSENIGENLRTSNSEMFENEELLDIFDLYEDIDLISYMYDYENLLRANIPLDRKSLCTGKPNTYGHCLLDFCRKNNTGGYTHNPLKGQHPS